MRANQYYRALNRGLSIFDPTSIGDCELWYDVSDDSTITRLGTISVASGTLDLVSQLDDKSGNARHLLQATEANRPAVSITTKNANQLIQSLSTGRFMQNGSDFTLSGYPITVFLVGRQQHGVYFSYAQPGVNNRRILFNNQSDISGNFQVRSGGAGTQGMTANTTLTVSQYYCYEGITESDTLRRFAVDGGAYSDNTETVLYTSSTRAFLFRSSNANPIGISDGFVGEVIMYSKSLTSEERTQVIDYLTTKWGL